MAVTIAANGVSISITIFILSINFIIFFLPFIMDYLKTSFTKNIISDLIIKRACYVLGCYLLVLNTTIIANLSSDAGFTLTKELLFYSNFFGWAGYLFMIYLVIKTIIDSFKLARNLALNKRMGEDL